MPEHGPFAVLGFIAGPALLTNASSVMLLATVNRYARALDRARALAAQMKALAGDSGDREMAGRLLDAAQRRVLYIVRSLIALYLAIGCFGLGTLSFLLGSSLLEKIGGVQVATIVMFATTVVGVSGLVFAMINLAWEGALSYAILREEAERVRAAF